MENNYYTVTGKGKFEGEHIYNVRLNPTASIYRGHFPGNPVSPGVCNLRMIAECAADLTGRNLRIRKILRCRFLSVITPEKNSRLWIRLQVQELQDGNGLYAVAAQITDGDKVCVDFKGELTE